MKRSVRIFWRIFLFGFLGFVSMILLANFGVLGKMPSLKELENPTMQQAAEIYTNDGTLMGKYYTEHGNRSNVKYSQISHYVIDALVATEDERFYDHSGVDFKSTMRAITTLGNKGGGSTITQQLALNLFNERASNKAVRVIQKLKEWIIAVKLERNFTKEEIITLYLNAVPFGNNVYGIRNAARTYFQKEPIDLKAEEAAMLIGILKANTLYNPLRNPKQSLERRNVVLNQMAVNKKITPAEADKLKALPLKLNYKKLDENTGFAPYFREVLREEVKGILKDIKKPNGDSYNIYNDGLRIYTTINPRMQEYAEEAVAAHMPILQRQLNAQWNVKNGSIWKNRKNILDKAMKASDRWKNLAEEGLSDKEIEAGFQVKTKMKVFAWNKNRQKDTTMTPYDSIRYHRQMMQTSFMVMDPITGEVKAWVGGIDFKTFKFDHVNLKTKRQVGSTIKPLLYTQAMEERGFTPETACQDVQQNFGGGRLVPATSRTCSGGTISMASALARSKNCATAFIMKQVGPQQFAHFLSNLNIPTKVAPHPSIALGSCDLSLYEMLWGYSIFAGSGFSTQPYMISRIEDRNGNVIKRFDANITRKEAISEVTAYNMARMMQGTVDVGTAAGLRNRIGVAEMGGKTGTTNDNADFWFMGYTPELLGGTWIGCDDRFITLNTGSGGSIARPIWEIFFRKAYNDRKLGLDRNAKFEKPAELELEINSADIMNLIEKDPELPAEGEDQGVGTESDYYMDEQQEYIAPESKPLLPDDDQYKIEKDENKEDTAKKSPKAVMGSSKPIGSENTEPKKKQGFLKKIFGKKEKKD